MPYSLKTAESTIAVFLVLGGATAFAAGKVGTSDLKAGAVTTAKIKARAITTGKIKKDAVTGAKVKESTLGVVPSESANPEAFAQIGTNGTVNAKLAKGITEANVKHPSEGVYCITVPGFTPRGGQSTPQFGGSNGTTTALTIGGHGILSRPGGSGADLQRRCGASLRAGGRIQVSPQLEDDRRGSS